MSAELEQELNTESHATLKARYNAQLITEMVEKWSATLITDVSLRHGHRLIQYYP